MRHRPETRPAGVLAALLLLAALLAACTAAPSARQEGRSAPAPAERASDGGSADAGSARAGGNVLARARTLYEEERYPQARVLLERLVRAEPHRAEAHRLLGHVLVALEEPEAARAAYVRALQQGGLDAATLRRLVQVDREADRPRAVLASLGLLQVLEPEEPRWALLYGDTLARLGEEAAATAVYRSLAESGAVPEAWLRLGNAHLRAGRLQEAAGAFETAWELGAESAELARTLGDVWHGLDEPATAVAWYDRLLARQDPPAPADRLRRAELLLATGRADAAREAAEGVRNDAGGALAGRAGLLLGRIANHQGREDDAERHWSDARVQGQAPADVLAWLGSRAYNRGDYARAAELLGERLRSGGPDAELRRFLVLSLLQSDQPEAARTELERYVARHGMNADAEALTRRMTEPDAR